MGQKTVGQLKKGDKVEIVSNIPYCLKDKPRPILGRVTNVDGAYIMVELKCIGAESEFYPNEIRKI